MPVFRAPEMQNFGLGRNVEIRNSAPGKASVQYDVNLVSLKRIQLSLA